MSKNKMNYRVAAHRARIVSRVLCHEDRGCVPILLCEYSKSIVHVAFHEDRVSYHIVRKSLQW